MSESLCPDCRSIDFQKYIHTSRYLTITLGTWSQIMSSTQCPFCRLVRDAISLHAHKPTSASTIKLFNRQSWRCCTSYNEYHGIRWQAYSNESDLQAYAEKTKTNDRYQFVVSWDAGEMSNKKRFEVFLRPVEPGPFFGRAVNQDHANLDLCRNWLDLCDDYHAGPSGECVNKRSPSGNLLVSLRLIDVNKMVIVKWSTSETQYVALSYVWGEDRMKREMPKSLKTAVQVVDGVETIKLPWQLPRTIRDAIHVTSAIGYKYLWVDSLCIVQDDEKDRHNQINMMDEIYSNAVLTIAAGSGLHADWGLPGVSRPRHFAQRSEIVNEIELAVEFPSFRKLNSGTALVWNTRGWTLQEKVLSKRLLLFTDFQMYFRCANSVCAEDIAMETKALSTSIKRRPNPFEWGFNAVTPGILQRLGDFVTFEKMKLTDKGWDLTFLPNYVALVAEYSQRNFRFKRDTLQAISGVLQTLDSSDLGYLAFPGGLPQAWLAEGLLWQPKDGSEYSVNHKARVGIPSWSWGAWDLSQGCVWTEYAQPGAIARGAPKTTIFVEDQGGYIRSYCGFGNNRLSSAVEKLTLSVDVREQLKISGTLLSFETSVCRFEIGPATHSRKLGDDMLQTYYLHDHQGRRVGKIWACGKVRRAWKARGPSDIIALSNRHTGLALKDAVAKKYRPKDSEGGDQLVTKWKVRNVMLVKWVGEVALRVAVGQIISTAWSEWDTRLIYLG